MRHRQLGWLLIGAWLGVMPLTAHADALSDAQAAMQKGDLPTARIDLQNAVDSDPQDADAHYWLGKVSLDLGDPVSAEREARAARDRGFDVRQALPLLAQSLMAQNKYRDLLRELQPAGTDATLDASILVTRGYAQIAMNDPDAAMASFTLAEKTAPDALQPLLASARLLIARGDLEGAQWKVDRALSIEPKSPEALLGEAEVLHAKGDMNGSLAALDQVLADQPGNATALLDRAELLIAANRPETARADLDKVLTASPGNVQAIYLQAVLQVQAKDYRSADATLEKIGAFVAQIPRGYFLQAVIKEELGETAQAEEAAHRYIASVPGDLAAYKMLARIEFARRRPDLAAEALGKAIGTIRGDAEAYDLLGRAYAATGRDDDAVAAFQKAETLAPGDIGLQLRLAGAHMGTGEPEAAMSDLEHTLQLAPTAPQVGEALFSAALATGDLSKARAAIETVRAAQGDTASVQNLAALLTMAQLNFDDAAARFRDIVRQHPEFTPAQINLARVSAMQGKSSDAEEILSGILAKDPDGEPALTMLASQMMQTDRMSEAIALVEKAHNALPANAGLTANLANLYIRSGKAAQALDIINNDATAAGSLELLGVKAAAQIDLNRKEEARETYALILKIDPTMVAARRQLEDLLVQAGDYEGARNAIKEGLVVSPRNYQLYQDYVMVDLKANGVDAALATAKQLQQQDRDLQSSTALIGDVYMAANRPEDAVRAYRDAMEARPSEKLAGLLTAALWRSDRRDEAITVLAEWIAQHPSDLTAMRQLSDLYIAVHRHDDAVKQLHVVLNAKPHDPLALNNLAWVYQQQGDKRAEALARQAYLVLPDGQTADTLGWILVSDGDAARGVTLMRQAAAQESGDPRVQYHYAVALKATGGRDEAIRLLTAVVANKGDFPEKADAQKLLDALGKG
ncbi:MAG: XrtA/PEP-CTERM system TPR-repeat protein PrsT [Acetobacteraceae bacterium]